MNAEAVKGAGRDVLGESAGACGLIVGSGLDHVRPEVVGAPRAKRTKGCEPGKSCGGGVRGALSADAPARVRLAAAEAGLYRWMFLLWIGLPWPVWRWRRWRGDRAEYPGCHCVYSLKLGLVLLTSVPAKLWRRLAIVPRPVMARKHTALRGHRAVTAGLRRS